MFQPYDLLALVPVIKGAGGTITDWKGHDINWEASADSRVTGLIFVPYLITVCIVCVVSLS